LMAGGIVCLLASVAFATKLSMIRETSRAFYKDMKDAKFVAKPVPIVEVVKEPPVVPANP